MEKNNHPELVCCATNQANAEKRTDGIAPTLTSFAEGGTCRPYIAFKTDHEKIVLNDQGGERMDVSYDVTATLRANTGGHQPLVMEPKPYTLKVRGGVDIDSNGHGAGKGPLVQTDLSATLGTSNDQTLFVPTEDPFVIDRAAYNQGQNAKWEPFIARSQVAPPLLATGPAAVGIPSDEVKVYGISPYHSNAMMSDNPDSGIYEAETSRTLDVNGGNPACNQGGIMICELYRKEGHARNAEEGQGCTTADVADTLNVSDISEARQSMLVAGKSYQEKTGPLMANSHPGGRTGQDAYNDMLVTQPYTVGNGQVNQLYLQENAGSLDCMHEQQIVLYEMQHAADVISDNIGIAPTLQHRMGTGGNQVPFTVENTEQQYTVRRLTPIECARLQGFPDDWCADVPHVDSAEYKMWGNGMALPCSLYIMEGIAELFEESKEN